MCAFVHVILRSNDFINVWSDTISESNKQQTTWTLQCSIDMTASVTNKEWVGLLLEWN